MGIAHQRVRRPETATRSTNVAPISLRDERERGLLARGWINGAGPFTFAIDTGAGVSLVSPRVVGEARLGVTKSSRPLVGGLSTSPIASSEETQIAGLSLGFRENRVPGSFRAAVVTNLPSSIDGILDPTEVFSPFGYSIDLPNRELRVFNTTAPRLRTSDVLPGGTVVRWVREAGSHRPFVRLEDGRLALLDTGSGFGLALNEGRVASGANHRRDENTTHDLGGGRVQSRRVEPQTVSIGALVLRGVPTDVLTGVAPGTPIILGRRALFPFRLTFDPAARLIAIEPVATD
ncbi:MAG TPA: pepsin/retropepsin-like aspartic protease family protein [Pyrinomonadaceae bacterium]|nr:pepsin/retropepsin-like aspartic protease family protein [Pyrinomonadaceae bacterium]